MGVGRVPFLSETGYVVGLSPSGLVFSVHHSL